MAITINGTTGVAGVAGSASTPALQGTDNNTGVFYPAADTVAIATNGTEAMRVDSSGNVGIGVTPSAIASGFTTVDISGSNGGVVNFRKAGTSFGYFGGNGSEQYMWATANIPLTFATNNTERARIDSSGNLLVGITSTADSHTLVGKTASSWSTRILSDFSTASQNYGLLVGYRNAAPNNTSNDFFYANDTGGARATIRSNGGLANYQANNVNLSDRREKINFAPAGEYLSKICSIPVQTFNYIDQNLEEDPGLTLGVVAQDVQAVAPELVMESNWGTKDDPKMRLSIYQTDLQYALMKCIQEQQALIESLTARIAALEAK